MINKFHQLPEFQSHLDFPELLCYPFLYVLETTRIGFCDLLRDRSGFRILVQIDLLSMDKRSAIATCLGVVLVLASSTLEVCVEAEGAASSCTIYAITECLEDINSYSAQPSQSCCTEIFALESGGLKAVDCLYTAVTSETAGLYGVNPQSAIGMPHRCGLPVPHHTVCNSMKVPGGWP